MISVNDARNIMLSMPEAEQKEHSGHPDFRICNKIFGSLDKNSLAVVKVSIPDQIALMQLSPETFSLNGWSHHGWTNVHLHHISKSLFKELVKKSWKIVAPKKILKLYPELDSFAG
jgi:hypothetical protein